MLFIFLIVLHKSHENRKFNCLLSWEMEIPGINRFSGFQVGVVDSLKDLSLFARSYAVSGIGKVYLLHAFWKWGALLIAFLASFTTIITSIKSLILRLNKLDVPSSSIPLLDDYDSDSSDISCPSSDQDDDDDDDDEEEDYDSGWRRGDGDIRVRGSDYYINYGQEQNGNCTWSRRRSSGSFGELFSSSNLGGSGVVKLWDHLDKRDGVSTSPIPAVVLEAEKSTGSSGDAVEVRAWDTRDDLRTPAILAEWRKPGKLRGRIIGVDTGGVEKIYVWDKVTGEIIAVGDMRRVNGALTNLTESDMETWWTGRDANVINL